MCFHNKAAIKARMLMIVLIFAICFFDGTHQEESVVRRFQYKFSLKGPNISREDGTIPFWKMKGSAIADQSRIRLTSTLHNQRGSVWSSKKFDGSGDWEFEAVFQISRDHGLLGGDGMAFWYTSEILGDGPAFGSSEKWNGFAVFFDSYNNVTKSNSATFGCLINNGSFSFRKTLKGYSVPFRSTAYASHQPNQVYLVTLTYSGRSLLFRIGEQNKNPKVYDVLSNIDLPQTGYFGISASTSSDLYDNHDLLSFIVHSYVRVDVSPRDLASKGLIRRMLKSSKILNHKRIIHETRVPVGNEHFSELMLEKASMFVEDLSKELRRKQMISPKLARKMKKILTYLRMIYDENPTTRESCALLYRSIQRLCIGFPTKNLVASTIISRIIDGQEPDYVLDSDDQQPILAVISRHLARINKKTRELADSVDKVIDSAANSRNLSSFTRADYGKVVKQLQLQNQLMATVADDCENEEDLDEILDILEQLNKPSTNKYNAKISMLAAMALALNIVRAVLDRHWRVNAEKSKKEM